MVLFVLLVVVSFLENGARQNPTEVLLGVGPGLVPLGLGLDLDDRVGSLGEKGVWLVGLGEAA